MEARYLTNEEGERLGVVVSEDEYEELREAREQLAHVEKQVRDARELLKGTLKLARSLGEDDYHEIVAVVADEFSKRAGDPEKVREYLEDLEDMQAEIAYDEDVEELERGEAELVPWERSKARRRGGL